jgi:hypothetical protein
MNTSDLGVLGDLATALGLVHQGQFREDWLSDPGGHLSRMLAEAEQRDALVRFIDEVLGGEDRATGPDGAVWLPIAEVADHSVRFYAVIDDRPANEVHIGLAVKAVTNAPQASVSAKLPLFRAAKTGHSVPNPLLLGEGAARATLAVDITVDSAAAVPGQAHLGGVALTLSVPTGAGGAAPQFGLTLRQLQMPGATGVRDLTLSVSDLASLQGAALDLVLGLVRAQAAALGTGPLAALAGLVGLGTGSLVPPLPLADLVHQGLPALSHWFGNLLSNTTQRDAWLTHLRDLLGGVAGGVSLSGGKVSLPLGPLALTVEVPVSPGSSGSVRLAPTIAIEKAAAAGVLLRAEATLCSIDLGSGAAQALPQLSLALVAGVAAGGAALVTLPNAATVRVESLRAGLSLDGQRRPVFLLAAEKVTIGTAPEMPRLDLSTPEALAQAGGTVLDTVAGQLLNFLGPALNAVRVLLGLSAPAGHAEVPVQSLTAFVQDPLSAVRAHWAQLVQDHRDAVPVVLQVLRDLVADQAATLLAVQGTGRADDPWRVPLAGVMQLRAWSADGRLTLAAAAATSVDDFARPGTRLQAALTAELLDMPLTDTARAAQATRVLPAAGLDLQLFTHGHNRVRVPLGLGELRADHVEISARWQQGLGGGPATGLKLDLRAPGLLLDTGSAPLALPLPKLSPTGQVVLTDAEWRALEQLLAELAQAAAPVWLDDVVALFGWVRGAPPVGDADPARLSLQALLADPQAALQAWLAGIVKGDSELLRAGLQMLATLLTGTLQGDWGVLDGRGSPRRPWRVPLSVGPLSAELLAWVGPEGLPAGNTFVLRPWQAWRPGMDALPSDALLEALTEQAELADDVAALREGRDELAAGLDALAARWAGGDGRVQAPAAVPAGCTVHRWPDLAAGQLFEALDLPGLLGRTPATVLQVVAADAAVAADHLPWGAPPAGRFIDLRAAALAPEAFDVDALVPAPAAGLWVVALGGRNACRLASGDADGLAGQSARLQRVLARLAALPGGLVLVADAAAGHAARDAAQAQPAVTALVTLGTPVTPVSLNVLDAAPGADALRLLARLLPPDRPEDPNDLSDDPDLALGRGLVTSLTDLLASDDPARELRPPATAAPAPRAGLDLHLVYGEASESAVQRALTAIVAAGLTLREAQRLAHDIALPDSVGLALRARLGDALPSDGSVGLRGHTEVELAHLQVDGDGVQLRTARKLRWHLELGRAGGWLVGGPDPGRAAGTPPPAALRRLDIDLEVPLTSDGSSASATLTLVDAQVFGLSRERWRLQAADLVLSAEELQARGLDAATTLLPEARVLLSGVVEAMAASTAPAVQALQAAMRALGCIDTAGGSVAAAIEHLLNDPLTHLQAVLADAVPRGALVSALRQLLPQSASLPAAPPDTVVASLGPLTATLTLAPAWRVELLAQADAGANGWLGWQGALAFNAQGIQDGHLALGTPGTAATGSLQLVVERSLRTQLLWHRPGLSAPESCELFPQPQIAPLATALVRLVPAELARRGVQALREALSTAASPAAPAVDALLETLGLLGPLNVAGVRRLPMPVALFADPGAWLRHASVLGTSAGAYNPARLVSLLESLRPLLGVGPVTGVPGSWKLAEGLALLTDTEASGAARLTLSLDSTLFTAPAGARLAAGGAFSLTLPAGTAPRAGIEFFAGLPGAASGRSALHVAVGGTGDGPLRVFLRPATGADIELFPHLAGFGALAGGATMALPWVLNAIADMAGQPGLRGDIGLLTQRVGDALALRSAGQFNGDALRDWATQPAAAFAARLPALAQLALDELAGAIRPLLPPAATLTSSGGTVQLQVGSFSLSVTPAPFAVGFSGSLTALPALSRAHVEVALDAAGLKSLLLEAGPAEIHAGGVTLKPCFTVVAGRAPIAGARAALTLGLPGDRRVGARWIIGGAFDLVLLDTGGEHTALDQVAVALLEAVLDVVASFVVNTAAVNTLMGKSVGGTTVDAVLRGVLLEDAVGPRQLIAQPFNTTLMLARLQRLLHNLAAANPSVTIDGALTIGLSAAADTIGVRLALPKPAKLLDTDVTLSLENDASWIHPVSGPALQPGIVINLLQFSGAPGTFNFTFKPGVSVNGVGLRVAGKNKPLLDAGGFSLGSIALHGFGRIGMGDTAGGVQLQFAQLAAGVGGASGGNAVAQGIMADTGKGAQKLAPAFSPALSIQKHGSGPVLVGLRAGDGEGPWWLAIQRGFGPVYIEQVGFGVSVRQDQLQSLSLLLDGRVSLLGLTASVDDLQLTFVVASNASVFDPSRWAVDLAGLAFASDMGGLTIQGGLRKFGSGDNVQYVGMLMGRFAVYGLSIFGGYGQGSVNGQKFASFFAFGAVNGPIGGPPAFFLTGIGGGLGINRQLVLPSDFSHFGDYPLIKALDPAAKPAEDPMAELVRLGDTFPMARGSFWFAAGVSFTSFALVDGVAVVSVQVGDGLEVALLGLARMALPRPQVALVSIELGLLARFSSKEGVLWVQAQLTDNSWLLYPEVRLTGGFAFVIWFGGPNRGQFVLTLGGYHPSFSRAGYPVVPRLGLQWRVGPFISVKGESYFALTSEALMAGVRVEVSARFGPAWAQVVFGADGIVFFDPFHFQVRAYASIAAGVTIDVWIGEITISISISATIQVEGPKFHGVATFSVGPVDLSVEFGDSSQPPRPLLPWEDFVRKYLEEVRPGVARALAAVPGRGALPPGAGPGGATDTGTADGSAERPFEVYAEFELTLTSNVPTRRVVLGPRTIDQAPSHMLGLAPMGVADARTELQVELKRDDNAALATDALQFEVRRAPGFPLGVWGPVQNADNPKLPTGDVIEAIDGVRLFTVAVIPAGLPPIDYRNRVEARQRLPLPFVSERAGRVSLLGRAATLGALLPAGAEPFATGGTWLAHGGASATALAQWRGQRAAPPRLGALVDTLRSDDLPRAAITTPEAAAAKPVHTQVQRPQTVAVLSAALDQAERIAARTTVSKPPRTVFIDNDPPTLAAVQTGADPALPARLKLMPGLAALGRRTVLATQSPPLTRIARAPVAAVRGRGAARDVRLRLAALNGALGRAGGRADQPARAASALGAGEVLVLAMPNAARDLDAQAPRPRLQVRGEPCRVVALKHGGEVAADVTPGVGGWELPQGTERVAVAVGSPRFQPGSGARRLMGWHAGSVLPYLGWRTALGAQAVVHAQGVGHVQISAGLRREAGWVEGHDLVAGSSLVATRFAAAAGVLVVVLDDPLGTTTRRGLSLVLEGGALTPAADGQAQAPHVVVRGQRTHLVYDVQMDEGAAALHAHLASDEGWTLVGVMAAGTEHNADEVAGWLAEGTLDTLVPGAVANGPGLAEIAWLDPQEAQPAPKAAPKATPKAAAKAVRRKRKPVPA